VIGLEVERSEPLYVEGHRPWQMGWVMSSGGKTVGIWLELVGGADRTRVRIHTARTSFGRRGQKDWTGAVFREMARVLGKLGVTMTTALAAALDAFYLELNGGTEGDCVWMTCSCGAAELGHLQAHQRKASDRRGGQPMMRLGRTAVRSLCPRSTPSPS